MGCFPSKRAAEQVHPQQELQAQNVPKPEDQNPASPVNASLSRIQAPASSRASTPTGRKVSPITKSEPILQQAAAAGAPGSVLAKPNSLAYEIPLDSSMKSPSGSGGIPVRSPEGSGGIHSQPPFQIAKDEQDPDELRRKIEEKEAQAAERRAAELAKREEVLKQQEEHAKQVKARRLNADEVAMDGTDGVRRSARKIDAAPIAEEEESEAGDA